MPTEGANHISEFNAGLPEGSTDQVLIVDDHFNMMKDCLMRDINGFTGSALIFGESTHSSNVYPINLTKSPLAYTKGMILVMRALNANTGAVDVNIASLGAKNLLGPDGAQLVASDITANDIVVAIYDGTDFRVLGIQTAWLTAFISALIEAYAIPLVNPATLNNAVVLNTNGSLADAGLPLVAVASDQTSEASLNAYYGSFSMSHALGVAPQLVNLWLVCKSANNGYAVGDEISFSAIRNSSSSDNNSRGAWTYDVSSTEVRLFGSQRTANAGDTPYLPVKTPTATSNYFNMQFDGTWSVRADVFAVTGTIASGV